MSFPLFLLFMIFRSKRFGLNSFLFKSIMSPKSRKRSLSQKSVNSIISSCSSRGNRPRSIPRSELRHLRFLESLNNKSFFNCQVENERKRYSEDVRNCLTDYDELRWVWDSGLGVWPVKLSKQRSGLLILLIWRKQWICLFFFSASTPKNYKQSKFLSRCTKNNVKVIWSK
jgi:hypothetical protein